MALNNSQFDEIMHEYNKRQAKANDELEARREQLLSTVPEYKSNLDLISETSVAAAKAMLKGNEALIRELQTKINRLENKLKQAIADAGYPEDYLTPEYICKDCSDTGFIGNKKCHCFHKKEIALLYRQSNIKNIVARENFKTFNINLFSSEPLEEGSKSPREVMAEAVDICHDFVKGFPSGDNILLFGASGVGKTFLTNCIAKELLDSSHSVIYLSAIELFEYFSSKFENNGYSGLDNLGNSMQIIECDLLIIDDLGTELTNTYTNSKLFYCINQRILLNRSTIISTNFSLSELMSTYSERIFSRISKNYRLIKLIGEDIRLK